MQRREIHERQHSMRSSIVPRLSRDTQSNAALVMTLDLLPRPRDVLIDASPVGLKEEKKSG